MRHKKGIKKLNKPTDQRLALLKNLVKSLFSHSKIKTTDLRAKQAQKLAEKLITFAKNNDFNSRRKVFKILADKSILNILFSKVSPKFSARNGGYTRITKLGYRKGDGALISQLELVD